MKRKNKGFSIVELIVAVAVMGILAAGAGLIIGSSISSNQETACETEKRMVETAVDQFRLQYGRGPSTMEELALGGTTLLRELPENTDIRNFGEVIFINKCASNDE